MSGAGHQHGSPLIGVVSPWGETERSAPLASAAAVGVRRGGGAALLLSAPATPPAPGGGDPGARLVAREVTADAVEVAARATGFEALVGIPSDAISLAAMAMAVARLDLPCVLLPPGAQDATAVGLQALGLCLPASSESGAPEDLAARGGERAVEVARSGPAPRALLTREAMERALATVSAAGASTNAILHLLAIGFDAEIELDLEDVDRATEGTRSDLSVVWGSLAPEGALMRASAGAGSLRGAARVFDAADAAADAVRGGRVASGEVLVVRYEGPRGGPGMPELSVVTDALEETGLAGPVALVTDGRIGDGVGGAVVGHVAPEAANGGPLAAVEDGDPIWIVAEDGRLDVEVPAEMLDERLERWFPPLPRATTGALGKYARLVKSASRGAICY